MKVTDSGFLTEVICGSVRECCRTSVQTWYRRTPGIHVRRRCGTPPDKSVRQCRLRQTSRRLPGTRFPSGLPDYAQLRRRRRRTTGDTTQGSSQCTSIRGSLALHNLAGEHNEKCVHGNERREHRSSARDVVARCAGHRTGTLQRARRQLLGGQRKTYAADSRPPNIPIIVAGHTKNASPAWPNASRTLGTARHFAWDTSEGASTSRSAESQRLTQHFEGKGGIRAAKKAAHRQTNIGTNMHILTSEKSDAID